ncbi:MAG: hypothetical protein KC620_10775, partial [Myxococcales bacterium]|nr:hypothetical protein [Myxococcales bacterium]
MCTVLPVCLFALFALSAPATLPPGRYLGLGAAGQVHLELLPDGSARFGGATFKWTRTEKGLRLVPPAGAALELAL